MQAWIARPGARPSLGSRPVPEPAPDEVLVRVRAVALNNADAAPAAREQVPGFEFSGVVDTVGRDVDPSLVGRRVMGGAPAAFADLVVAHHRHVVAVPDGLDLADAAALPTALFTEYGALRTAGIRAGDSVLVTAATSGIALVGLQVARVLGAEIVSGTTRSESHRALLERAGADHVVAGTDGLADAVRAVTGGAGAGVVLDHVGGAGLAAAIGAAAHGGSVVSVGRLAGGTAEIDLFRLAAQGVLLRSVSYGFSPPEVIGDLLDGVAADVLDAVGDGRVRPVIGASMPFGELPAALDLLERGRAEGKVVLVHD